MALSLEAPVGYQQIVAATTVAATALTVPEGATKVIVQAEAQAARWRDDGTDPTAAVGMVLPVATELVYRGNLARIKFINATAGTILNCSFYK